VCGLPEALSLMLSVAFRAPVVVGVKVTVMVQELAGATLAPVQVSPVLAKSPGFEPVKLTPEIASVAAPVLVTVSVSGALVV
jgi:hypothetical protein